MIKPIKKFQLNKNIVSFDREKLNDLCRRYDLKLVILHGSYATGRKRKKSDIDIAILGRSKMINENYLEIIGKFSGLFGDNCDLAFLNNTESMIVYQAAIKGIPLYEAEKGGFADFKTTAISTYQDAKKFRELEKHYLRSALRRMN